MKKLSMIFAAGKRYALPVILVAFAAVFTACNDDDDSLQLETVHIEGELPRVAEPLNSEAPILKQPTQGGVDAWVCNTPEQIERTQTAEFLKKYPEYLDVEFTKYSVVFYRTMVLNYSHLKDVKYEFYKCIADEYDPSYGTYRIVSQLSYDDTDWTFNPDDTYILQIAFLVPRIDSRTPVNVIETVE